LKLKYDNLLSSFAFKFILHRYTKEVLEGFDVVLTTYPVVEGEWRKVINKTMVECQYCNKKLLPRSLVPHQMYFCGPDAVRTAKLAKRETKQDLVGRCRSTLSNPRCKHLGLSA
jgi:DNA repair protein RAD16